jgi:hypothetical protein
MLLALHNRFCYNVPRFTSREAFMETLTFWTAASIILLALEMIVLMLIPGAILFFSIRGLWAMEKKMREVSPKVQGAFRQVNLMTHQAAEKVVAPVIKVEATNAQIRAIGNGTTSLLKRREVQT